ncbi:hypothetical protein GOP47_0009328 [Adiantum capillus-veneris]|uniref:Uncharacterized protein n=1 Tax=Adiantum capillus-veneris TaxID=13818 RepID=A0A9D4UXK7_ADICA|nr:hypothetical protein GOP47_0009328 [Adiantum capillus-veneris]
MLNMVGVGYGEVMGGEESRPWLWCGFQICRHLPSANPISEPVFLFASLKTPQSFKVKNHIKTIRFTSHSHPHTICASASIYIQQATGKVVKKLRKGGCIKTQKPRSLSVERSGALTSYLSNTWKSHVRRPVSPPPACLTTTSSPSFVIDRFNMSFVSPFKITGS